MATPTALPAEIVRGIRNLDPLPVTAQRLLELVNGKDIGLATIAELIEFDPPITALVLRRASTAERAGLGVPSVREAVMRLGTVALLDTVMEGYLHRLRSAAPLYDLSEHDLWVHGAAAQLAVRALAAERPQAKIPALAETAALLHDLGKLIVSRHMHADVREIVNHAQAHGLMFVQAERELLGVDHTMVGAVMAEEWHFPRPIVEAIRRHHSPPFTGGDVVLDAVALANVVAKTIQTGLGAEGLNFNVDPGSYRRLGVDFAAFARVCLQTETWLRELVAAHAGGR